MTVDWSLVSDDDWRHALRKNHAKLIESLDCSSMVSALFSASVITPLIKEEIETERNRATGCNTLLDRVRQRGKQAFRVFVEQLIATEQQHLYDLVISELRQRVPKAFTDATPAQAAAAAVASQRPPVGKSAPTIQVDAGVRRSASSGPAVLAASVRPSSSTTTKQPHDSVYVAVQLFMSLRHTHLEVQAVCHGDLAALEVWLRAWKDEEPDQPDMPRPRPVVTALALGGETLVARLTSSAVGGGKPYHHACEETAPRPLQGCGAAAAAAVGKPSAWLFQLAGLQPSEQRTFSLHLHRATTDASLGDEICTKFEFQDYSGKCFMQQLGFTRDNQQPESSGSSGSYFARSATSGGIYTAQAMRRIGELSNSVGAVFIAHMQMIGTGFCVGTSEEKYFMTCYHVYNIPEVRAALDAEKLLVVFADSVVGARGPVCQVTHCVEQNEFLDYIILGVKEQDKMPLPIKCCPEKFEDLTRNVSAQYFTIVGYFNSVRTIDVVVDWLMPTPKLINLMKAGISEKYPELQSFLTDYDEIANFTKDGLFYNVARHKHGSSGAPVFYCTAANDLYLVALHSRGMPDCYYTKPRVKEILPITYTLEAGIRMSSIHSDLAQNPVLQRKLFNIDRS